MADATETVDIWVLIFPKQAESSEQLMSFMGDTNILACSGMDSMEAMLGRKVSEGTIAHDCGYPDSYYYAFLVDDGDYVITQEILQAAVEYSLNDGVEGEVHRFTKDGVEYDLFYISWLE